MINKDKNHASWYKQYIKDHYLNKNSKRDNILSNKEVLFQYLAKKKCFISSFSKLDLNQSNSLILDIGCGSCSDLINLVTLGFSQENLFGVDIDQSSINFGKKNYPLLNLTCQDASKLNFKNESFDLTFESTLFVQLTCKDLSQRIANEMLRVTKKNGYLIIFDWRYAKLNNTKFSACNKNRIQNLFRVNQSTKLISIHEGMLIPPVGRFISSNLNPSYFIVAKLFPFLIGQVGYILKKI